jgi:hypothetical protein
MKNPLIHFISLTLPLSILLLNSCRKESSSSDLGPQKEEEIASFSAASETETETIFNDVFDNVLGVNTEVGVGGIGVFGRISAGPALRETSVDSISSCLTLKITRLNAPDLFPVRVIIDFGNGCLGKDGHWRSGKIIAEYTGRLTEAGKSVITTFIDFKLDSISVEGSYSILNTSSSAIDRRFTIEIAGATMAKPSGDYIQWSSHRVILQTAGISTPDQPLDDVFSITGGGRGRLQRNNDLYAWESQITDPLEKKLSCHWISKGTIQIWRETLSSSSPFAASLNYGNGSCDFMAQVAINGNTKDVQLPH